MTNIQEGSVFAARYRVIKCIAAGGMGAVYEVVHLETERRRALKVMHAHFVQSAELRDRFKGEARVAAQIDSEFIVDVFDAGIEERLQMPFLVMELLKGEELGKRLERVGRLAPPEAITYLWQTALALDKTHKANIVHRDLKPENLFLTECEDGPPRVKVLDFGVAKFVAETGTQGGATRSLGTPLYMAPEQFRAQQVSPASDNYALGMMAFTLMVGETYWAREAENASDVIAFAMTASIGPVEPATLRASKRGVNLPPGFDAWFSRATATDPGARYPKATTTILALGEVFGINPARLTGVGSSEPLPTPAVGRTVALDSARPSTGTGTGTAIRSVGPGPVRSVGPTGPGFSEVGASGVVGLAVTSQNGLEPGRSSRRKSALGIVIGAIAFAAVAIGAIGIYVLKGSHDELRSTAAGTATATAAVNGEPLASASPIAASGAAVSPQASSASAGAPSPSALGSGGREVSQAQAPSTPRGVAADQPKHLDAPKTTASKVETTAKTAAPPSAQTSAVPPHYTRD